VFAVPTTFRLPVAQQGIHPICLEVYPVPVTDKRYGTCCLSRRSLCSKQWRSSLSRDSGAVRVLCFKRPPPITATYKVTGQWHPLYRLLFPFLPATHPITPYAHMYMLQWLHWLDIALLEPRIPVFVQRLHTMPKRHPLPPISDVRMLHDRLLEQEKFCHSVTQGVAQLSNALSECQKQSHVLFSQDASLQK
jgi:hypothetical protein